MNEEPIAAVPDPPSAAAAGSSTVASSAIAPSGFGLAGVPRALAVALGVLAVLSSAAVALAWKSDQRGAGLEQELVRRQQDVSVNATEARMRAKQAQESVSSTAAKLSLLEARVAEVAVQRTQLEDLIQSLSRSRDENLLVDVEASIRVALQQTAITGSAEPLVGALKQSDDRLARYNQPRLEGVRRAIARDLDRVKLTSVIDIASLAIRLDEAIRIVDELPLTSVADPKGGREAARVPAAGAVAASGAASAPWGAAIGARWNAFGDAVWNEIRSLVRVTRIDHPEAMLIAPEQSFFLRENLKLRLLNARLALLSRQFDTAQSDLQAAQSALDRYFDRSSKRTLLAMELVRQIAGQARQVSVPRPDDTLAALTAASAGR